GVHIERKLSDVDCRGGAGGHPTAAAVPAAAVPRAIAPTRIERGVFLLLTDGGLIAHVQVRGVGIGLRQPLLGELGLHGGLDLPVYQVAELSRTLDGHPLVGLELGALRRLFSVVAYVL